MCERNYRHPRHQCCSSVYESIGHRRSRKYLDCRVDSQMVFLFLRWSTQVGKKGCHWQFRKLIDKRITHGLSSNDCKWATILVSIVCQCASWLKQLRYTTIEIDIMRTENRSAPASIAANYFDLLDRNLDQFWNENLRFVFYFIFVRLKICNFSQIGAFSLTNAIRDGCFRYSNRERKKSNGFGAMTFSERTQLWHWLDKFCVT